MDRMVRKHKQQIKKDLLLKKKNGFIANLNAHLSLFILSDDCRNFVSWVIKAHSHSNYPHIMTMVHPNKVATQGLLFHETDMMKYLRDDTRLKVWYYPDMPKDMADSIKAAVEADLSRSWWGRRYDWLGIIGQTLGKHFRWINNPFLKYCSERVSNCVKIMFPDFNIQHPTPAEINAFFKTKKEMEVLCRWNAD